MDFNFSDLNTLPWLIPVGPLVAFALITLSTSRSRWVRATDSHLYGGHHPDYDGMRVPVDTPLGRVLSVSVGMIGVIIAWIISMVVFFDTLGIEHFGSAGHIYGSDLEWLSVGRDAFKLGVLVDPLTTAMLAMVPLTILCIFIYSIGYMAHDPRQSRFFAMIALFGGAMLTLVVADNLLLLFIGWEIMGLCSYLLIGFWFEKESAYNAAIKAFVTTRVADVLMLLGIAYLYAITGTLSFREIMYANDGAWLEVLANTDAILIGGVSAASLIGIFLIIGTIGKSSQFPLHVWLPDAMEGPTPVSAMIHAAAMVSAGVYMVVRMYPLLSAGSHPHDGELLAPMTLMAVVGAFTALFAATIAVAQNDIKRVLAYSTISQLGYMVAALGIGAYIAAAFHLITHGFFKALLFMASGSVIHAMEHGEHHAHELHALDEEHEHHEEEHDAVKFDPQDMRFMGGLKDRVPVTWLTFLAGGLSLAGFPLITAGFWSKDEILADAWLGTSHYHFEAMFVFFMLAVAAFLTAFYTARQLSMTFLGNPRTEAAEHAGLGGPTNIISFTMQLPLIILAVCALLAGFVGVPRDFPIVGWLMDLVFGFEHNQFHHFVGGALLEHPEAPGFNWIPVLISFSVALGGLFVGFWLYGGLRRFNMGREPMQVGEPDPLIAMVPAWLYNGMKNKWYIDEIYAKWVIKPAQVFASVVVVKFIDDGLIDGTLHTIGRVFVWIGDLLKVLNLWLIDGVGDGIPEGIRNFGRWIRGVQTGRAQQYLLLVVIAAILIGLALVVSTGVMQAAG